MRNVFTDASFLDTPFRGESICSNNALPDTRTGSHLVSHTPNQDPLPPGALTPVFNKGLGKTCDAEGDMPIISNKSTRDPYAKLSIRSLYRMPPMPKQIANVQIYNAQDKRPV